MGTDKNSFLNSAARANAAHLPSSEIVQGWKNECARIDAQIAVLQGLRDAYDTMIRGALALSPFIDPPKNQVGQTPGAGANRPASQSGQRASLDGGATTWTGVVEHILKENGRLSYDDLRAAVGKTHLAKKLAKTDKSFYGAIGKLADRAALMRHRGWLFSPAAYAEFQRDLKAGRATDEDAPKNNPAHQSPFGNAIKAFMDAMPEGAESKMIAAELSKTPDFADTMQRHKSHLYNVLARLVDQGELVKGGGLYYRAPNRSGGG